VRGACNVPTLVPIVPRRRLSPLMLYSRFGSDINIFNILFVSNKHTLSYRSNNGKKFSWLPSLPDLCARLAASILQFCSVGISCLSHGFAYSIMRNSGAAVVEQVVVCLALSILARNDYFCKRNI
jgi:hypothetical protein